MIVLQTVMYAFRFFNGYIIVYKFLNQHLITDIKTEISATAMKHLISSGMIESSTSRDTEPVVHVNGYINCENDSVEAVMLLFLLI